MKENVKKIVAIGDSVVYGRIDPLEGGWVYRLRKWFEAQRPSENAVFNLGIGGETSTGLLRRFRRECIVRNPDLILLSVGVNDCRHIGSPSKPLITNLEKFSQNIGTLLTIAKKITSKVVFVSMVPVDEARTTPIRGLYHYLADQQIFANHTKTICQYYNVPYVDNFSRWLSNKRYVELLADGLHPNTLGHQDLFKEIRDFLVKEII